MPKWHQPRGPPRISAGREKEFVVREGKEQLLYTYLKPLLGPRGGEQGVPVRKDGCSMNDSP